MTCGGGTPVKVTFCHRDHLCFVYFPWPVLPETMPSRDLLYAPSLKQFTSCKTSGGFESSAKGIVAMSDLLSKSPSTLQSR